MGPLLLTKGGQCYLCVQCRAWAAVPLSRSFCSGWAGAPGSPGALSHHVIPSPQPIRGVIRSCHVLVLKSHWSWFIVIVQHSAQPKPNQTKEGHCGMHVSQGRLYESCCVGHLMLYHVSHLMCMTTNAQSVLSLRRFVLHQLNV